MANINTPNLGSNKAPIDYGAIGRAIKSGAGAVGSFLNNLKTPVVSKAPSPLAPLGNLDWSGKGIIGNIMGAQAKSPTQNVTPPSNTISPSVTKTQPIQSTTAPSSVADYNTQFMKDNPQYGGTTGTQNTATIPQPAAPVTPPASTIGQTPSTSSTDPYGNSVNTQTTYASGQGNPQVNSATGGLLSVAQNQTPAVTEAEKQYNQFAQQSPYLLADVKNNPNVAAEVSVGRGQSLGQTLSAEQQALAQNVTNALSGQGQQITAGNEAGNLAQGQQTQQVTASNNVGNLTQPQAGAAFFGSPVTGGIAGAGTGLVGTAVQNAIQQVNNNADPASIRASLVAAYGAPAGTAFDSALLARSNGAYNPTAVSAASQQNAAQGATYQGQAAQLDTTLKQLDNLTPTVTNFLTQSGINNSDIPFYNEQTKTYIGALKNPANLASFNAMMADVKTYTAQILGNSGLNPTEVSATVNSFDPKSLSPQQLTSFLSNLKNLGQTRLGPLQQTSQNSYGGNLGYTGAPASPSVNSSIAPNSTGALGSHIDNPVIQGLIGGGINGIGGIEGLANSALGWAAAILK